MKINKKFLSIKPYISTTWSNITSLHMQDQSLFITLVSGKIVEIPNLSKEEIETIFSEHSKAIEEIQHFPMQRMLRSPFENPVRFGFSAIDGMAGMPLQHDPNQTDAPDLPLEVLEKISAIAKIFSPDEGPIAPQPVENCNCIHCQISRAINDLRQQPLEEDIKEAELGFQQWEIIQSGDKLYTVTNKLDQVEKYNVYLGNPVGCTCGLEGCEHILAVLKS